MANSKGFNARQIALNGSGGAWVVISATIVSRYAEAIEDFVSNGGAAQGIEYQFPSVDEGVVTWPGPVLSLPPSAEPLQLGDKATLFTKTGPILGQPGQQIIGQPAAQAATPIVRMRSASATATTINFTEYQ